MARSLAFVASVCALTHMAQACNSSTLLVVTSQYVSDTLLRLDTTLPPSCVASLGVFSSLTMQVLSRGIAPTVSETSVINRLDNLTAAGALSTYVDTFRALRRPRSTGARPRHGACVCAGFRAGTGMTAVARLFLTGSATEVAFSSVIGAFPLPALARFSEALPAPTNAVWPGGGSCVNVVVNAGLPASAAGLCLFNKNGLVHPICKMVALVAGEIVCVDAPAYPQNFFLRTGIMHLVAYVNASGAAGLTANVTYAINIVNAKPTCIAMPSFTAFTGIPVTWVMPSNTFNDAEDGTAGLLYKLYQITGSAVTSILALDSSSVTAPPTRSAAQVQINSSFVVAGAYRLQVAAIDRGVLGEPATRETATCNVDATVYQCTACTAGQYAKTMCTPTQDRVCDSCGTCGAGSFISRPCEDMLGPHQCTACSALCSQDTYELLPCSRYTDRICVPCARCSSLFAETVPCTAASDRQCRACDCDVVGTASCSFDAVANTTACSCKAGFTGARCDECVSGFFARSCDQPCSCDATGSSAVNCTMATGQCACNSGYSGIKCDRSSNVPASPSSAASATPAESPTASGSVSAVASASPSTAGTHSATGTAHATQSGTGTAEASTTAAASGTSEPTASVYASPSTVSSSTTAVTPTPVPSSSLSGTVASTATASSTAMVTQSTVASTSLSPSQRIPRLAFAQPFFAIVLQEDVPVVAKFDDAEVSFQNAAPSAVQLELDASCAAPLRLTRVDSQQTRWTLLSVLSRSSNITANTCRMRASIDGTALSTTAALRIGYSWNNHVPWLRLPACITVQYGTTADVHLTLGVHFGDTDYVVGDSVRLSMRSAITGELLVHHGDASSYTVRLRLPTASWTTPAMLDPVIITATDARGASTDATLCVQLRSRPTATLTPPALLGSALTPQSIFYMRINASQALIDANTIDVQPSTVSASVVTQGSECSWINVDVTQPTTAPGTFIVAVFGAVPAQPIECALLVTWLLVDGRNTSSSALLYTMAPTPSQSSTDSAQAPTPSHSSSASELAPTPSQSSTASVQALTPSRSSTVSADVPISVSSNTATAQASTSPAMSQTQRPSETRSNVILSPDASTSAAIPTIAEDMSGRTTQPPPSGERSQSQALPQLPTSDSPTGTAVGRPTGSHRVSATCDELTNTCYVTMPSVASDSNTASAQLDLRSQPGIIAGIAIAGVLVLAMTLAVALLTRCRPRIPSARNAAAPTRQARTARASRLERGEPQSRADDANGATRQPELVVPRPTVAATDDSPAAAAARSPALSSPTPLLSASRMLLRVNDVQTR